MYNARQKETQFCFTLPYILCQTESYNVAHPFVFSCKHIYLQDVKYTCMLFLAAVLVRLSLIISDFDLLRKFSCMILLPYDINYFKVQKLYTNHPYFLELSIITTEPYGNILEMRKMFKFLPKGFS